jgi:DNA (cytosine-5)-methyltransferase 1
VNAIDLFAGLGGFTEGATQAGAKVVWAANHWPFAVAAHAANHPSVAHACQDVTQADWSTVPPFDLLLASPACQGHSTASQPKRRAYHDALRASAWAVVDCADRRRPKALIVENVPAFQRWKLYPQWMDALRGLGYALTSNIVRASHHGVPQRRDRLFVVGLRDKAAFYLPRRKASEPPASEFIEYEPREGRDWKHIADAAPGAQARMVAAKKKHGAVVLSQHTTGHRGVPLSQPIRTITGQDHWVLVAGQYYRPLTIREIANAMGFPRDYVLPEASRADLILALGNAVCPPVARDVVRAVMEAA